MRTAFILFFVMLATSVGMIAQVPTQAELTTSKQGEQSRPGYFFYAKPFEVTMTVNVWGEVPQQGVYVVSTNTDIIQLLSYSGGPKDKSNLDEVLVYRVAAKKDQKTRTLKRISVRDILEGRSEPVLLAPGDMVVVQRIPDATSWLEVLTILNAGTSLAVLGITIYTLTKK